jgi:hypothetical protein
MVTALSSVFAVSLAVPVPSVASVLSVVVVLSAQPAITPMSINAQISIATIRFIAISF